MYVDTEIQLNTYSRKREADQIRDFGAERGFSNEPDRDGRNGRSRNFSEIDVVLSGDNAPGGKFAFVAISEKPLGDIGLKLSKIGGELVFFGVKLYWKKLSGGSFPKTDLPILMDTTITNHLGITEGFDRMRNVPTNKEHQAYSYLTTVDTGRPNKKVGKDDTLCALAKYLSARFWPGVVLQRVKPYEWNDKREISVSSFQNINTLEGITKTLWHADNLKFKNVQDDVVQAAMSVINTHQELSTLMQAVSTKHFIKQMSAVFLGLQRAFQLNPNIPPEMLGQAGTSLRRKLKKGSKIFSGYLNRGLKKHGFRAEITKVLLLRDGIIGANKYNGSGRGFNDPQAVRDREQIAHHLWGELLKLASK